jgi:hypothetical protein
MFSKRKRGVMEWGFRAEPSWHILTLNLILLVVLLGSTWLTALEAQSDRLCLNVSPVWIQPSLEQPQLLPLPPEV